MLDLDEGRSAGEVGVSRHSDEPRRVAGHQRLACERIEPEPNDLSNASTQACIPAAARLLECLRLLPVSQVRRRRARTDNGAKTARKTMAQTSDQNTGWATGPSTMRPRAASLRMVTGLALTTG
jgi:hypothetical protein